MRAHSRSRAFFQAGLALVALFASAPRTSAQEAAPSEESLKSAYEKRSYSPYAGREYPTRPFFGDTHLHTGYSFDAGAFGARLDPADAYRFARGEQVVSSTGQPVRLSRSLDFLVVADHSDNMGFFPKLLAGDPAFLADPDGRRWYDMIQKGGDTAVSFALEAIDRFSKGTFPKALWSAPGTETYRSAWQSTVEAAEAANAPGVFTAFIGYEWTSNTGGNNLHRVVVYRDGADKALQTEPYTTYKPAGSDVPEDLWKALGAYEKKTGGRLLAIAHNGNLSNGIMFPEINPVTAEPLTKEYAQTRAKWEPLYEVTQIKGDGETHPFLSPNDEFADYETWDAGNLNLSVPKKDEMLQYEYARRALQIGLGLEKRLGVNPYKFGLIGSTDSHTGLATADEDNFFGKHSGTEPSPERATHVVGKFGDAVIIGWQQAASGYAAVWAQENTRESLFAAMERRETYATTGPRMVVRFFGGYDFADADTKSRSPAEQGYAKGVPMGGDLPAAKGKTPSFLVAALRDPIGANLDRIQIVKGWLDLEGANSNGPYMGAGKMLGEKEKFEVVLHAARATHYAFTKGFTGVQVTGAVRWHFPGVHKMNVSIPCEDPDLKQDHWLFPHIVHNLSHLFFCAYKHFNYDPPMWIDEGLALAMEKEIDPRSTTNEGEEGTFRDDRGPSDYLEAARKMIARGRQKTMADLLYVKEVGEMQNEALITSWAIARFLLDEHATKFQKLLAGVKGQLDEKKMPSGSDLPGLQRKLLKEHFDWTTLALDELWKAWAMKSAPLK